MPDLPHRNHWLSMRQQLRSPDRHGSRTPAFEQELFAGCAAALRMASGNEPRPALPHPARDTAGKWQVPGYQPPATGIAK